MVPQTELEFDYLPNFLLIFKNRKSTQISSSEKNSSPCLNRALCIQVASVVHWWLQAHKNQHVSSKKKQQQQASHINSVFLLALSHPDCVAAGRSGPSLTEDQNWNGTTASPSDSLIHGHSDAPFHVAVHPWNFQQTPWIQKASDLSI